MHLKIREQTAHNRPSFSLFLLSCFVLITCISCFLSFLVKIISNHSFYSLHCTHPPFSILVIIAIVIIWLDLIKLFSKNTMMHWRYLKLSQISRFFIWRCCATSLLSTTPPPSCFLAFASILPRLRTKRVCDQRSKCCAVHKLDGMVNVV